jgi:tripartite motif-containing protein 71
MLHKRYFVTVIAAIVFALQMVGCGSRASIAREANPTIMSASTLEPAATASLEHHPELELVWEITGDTNSLSSPVGITVDQDGNVYVMDTENNRVQKFDSNGNFVSMWGSQGNGEGQFQNTSSQDWLGHMIVDTHGNLYVIDANNFRIQKFDSNGNYQTQWGTKGTGDGEFSFIPFDIAIDPQDNVYVCESASVHRVQKFDENGKFLLTWGKLGYKDGEFSSGDNCSVAVDPDGNILVADNSGRIQKFDANGLFLSKIILSPVNDVSVSLWNMAVDQQGNIYVGDATHALVIKLDYDGQVLASWTIGEAESTNLQDIAVDTEGNIYISDVLKNIVRKFRQT